MQDAILKKARIAKMVDAGGSLRHDIKIAM